MGAKADRQKIPLANVEGACRLAHVELLDLGKMKKDGGLSRFVAGLNTHSGLSSLRHGRAPQRTGVSLKLRMSQIYRGGDERKSSGENDKVGWREYHCQLKIRRASRP